MEQQTKQCQNCKQNFTIEPADFEFYAKINVPPPKECFYCRIQRLLTFWPFAKFNRRKCDFSGENIISIFPSNASFPVYKSNHWNSDKWERPQMNYDLNKPFFDQFYALHKKTSRPHQFGSNNQNCDYSDDVWDCKNCYLCRSLANCENLSYSYRTLNCRDSYDVVYSWDIENSYDCTWCIKLYNVKYAFDSRDSFDSAFLYDCRNVQNCFMCWNLRNKKYHILNRSYSKEEYFQKIKEYNLTSYNSAQFLKKEFERHIKEEAVHKTNFNTKSVNSSGNYLIECKDCRHSFFLSESEDCAYYFRGVQDRDVYDSAGVFKGELIYQCNQLTDVYNLKYCNYSLNCRDSEYLDSCSNCVNCFGCIGLKDKSYCVLNKQYSKEEYEKLVSEIKEKMQKDGENGKFFPYKMAYGGYNLSTAGVVFPKTKEEIAQMGAMWEDLEETDISGIQTIPFIDDINAVNEEEILGKAFICEESGRPFNIKKDELEFYKKHSIPLSHHYPDVRTIRRMKMIFNMNPVATNCFFCKKEIISYYPKEWGYKKIACEQCYKNEVL